MLQQTINTVKSLNDEVQAFYNAYKENIKYDKQLNQCIIEFLDECKLAIDKLENPLITIATVGTTTSGKSTILNAFTGRDIAPCNIDEMSAGILTFTPSETENKMVISKSAEGYWDGKTIKDASDDDMRTEIERIFNTYKSKKSKRECTAPKIEVYGKYLWNLFPQSFDLPSNTKFRFIDLPGLRTEKGDRKNLKVIQDVLREVRPLCVLSMDYSCLAMPETLQSLLSELSDTIKNLGGSTESIVFLLNKVDLYNQGQSTSLEDDIEKFRQRVVSKLSTEMPQYKEKFDNIKIIPYIGILHNNVQLSIGLNSHKYNQHITANQESLQKLYCNCSKIFGSTDDNEAWELFYRIQPALRRKETIEGNDLYDLIECSYKLSYADQLIDELKRRIKESLYEIVIDPAIFKLVDKYKLLTAYINNYISASKINNSLQIYARISGILENRIKIIGVDEEQRHPLLMNIEKSLEEIRNIQTSFKDVSEIYKSQNSDEENIMDFNQLEESFISKSQTDKEWVVSTIGINEERLSSIVDELKRKHQQISKYEELRRKIENGPVSGELRDRFQETIDANEIASKALSDYAKYRKENPDNAPGISSHKIAAQKTINSIPHKGVSALYSDSLEIVDKIKSAIQTDLLSIFHKVYPITEYSESDFEQDLIDNGIKTSSVHRLVNLFEIFRKQFNDWKYVSVSDDQYVVYNSTVEPNKNEFSLYNKEYECLNNEMRLAISDLMGYKVQLEYKVFVDNLKQILEKDTQKIIDEINNSGFDVNVASIISLLAMDCKINPEIPEKLFTFADPFYMGSHDEQRLRLIDPGFCDACDDYESYNVSVYTIKYPTNDGLYRNWTKGIAGAEGGFWQIVVDWVNDTITEQQNRINKVVSTVSNELLDDSYELNERLKRGAIQRETILNKINDSFAHTKNIFNNLTAK